MPLNLEIRTVGDEKDLFRLRDFILSHPLWYPQHDKWVEEVCIPEIETGWKTAVVAYSDRVIIGDAVWQPHKQLPRTREFKNLRVHPDLRRRDLGHFLLRQVEEEGRGTFDRIMLDTDKRNKGMITFLQFCGYQPIMETPLYTGKNVDVIMSKEFPSTDPYSLTPSNKFLREIQ